MVKIALLELPIQFTRNLPKIVLEFIPSSQQDSSSSYLENYPCLELKLKNKRHSNLDTWSYIHCLQDTHIIHFTGVPYGDYSLEITSLSRDGEGNDIPIGYKVSCQNQVYGEQSLIYSRTAVSQDTELNKIHLSVLEDTESRGATTRYGGALMTSGSFTMSASGGL